MPFAESQTTTKDAAKQRQSSGEWRLQRHLISFSGKIRQCQRLTHRLDLDPPWHVK